MFPTVMWLVQVGNLGYKNNKFGKASSILNWSEVERDENRWIYFYI